MKHKRPPRAYAAKNRFARVRVCEIDDAERTSLVELALSVLAERHAPGEPLASPDETRAYLRLRLSAAKAEVFGAIFVDNRHRVIVAEDLFHGTIDGASVHPRVVVQRALELNAAALVLYHNHPSGEPEPSRADRALTKRLKEALSLVDIRTLDHFVVGDQGAVSFAERGWL